MVDPLRKSWYRNWHSSEQIFRGSVCIALLMWEIISSVKRSRTFNSSDPKNPLNLRFLQVFLGGREDVLERWLMADVPGAFRTRVRYGPRQITSFSNGKENPEERGSFLTIRNTSMIIRKKSSTGMPAIWKRRRKLEAGRSYLPTTGWRHWEGGLSVGPLWLHCISVCCQLFRKKNYRIQEITILQIFWRNRDSVMAGGRRSTASRTSRPPSAPSGTNNMVAAQSRAGWVFWPGYMGSTQCGKIKFLKHVFEL